MGAQGGRALEKFASRECFNQAFLLEPGRACPVCDGGSVISTTVKPRGSSAPLHLRKTWEGEGTFPELKYTSSASPLQGLGQSGYAPGSSLLWKRLHARSCSWRAA